MGCCPLDTVASHLAIRGTKVGGLYLKVKRKALDLLATLPADKFKPDSERPVIKNTRRSKGPDVSNRCVYVAEMAKFCCLAC